MSDESYCARGRMENFIKDHKNALHSDRTSCPRFEANIFRLFLHGAAYVLVHALREKELRNADRIIVIDKGTIAEEGDHASLIGRKGLYYELYKLQFETV